MKSCTACGVPKTLDSFGPDRRNLDGRQSRCRECKNTADKAAKGLRRDEVNAKRRAARVRDPERFRKYSDKAYRKSVNGHYVRKQPLAERFWRHVQKSDACWLWMRFRSPAGYGSVSAGGRPRKAHRVAYELTYGKIPEGLAVCHHCDNPPCVRPDHLFLGTLADNNRDRDAKGRTVLANALKTHCPAGHEYNAENSYTNPKTGHRLCRSCNRQAGPERNRRYRKRRKMNDTLPCNRWSGRARRIKFKQ